MVKAATYVTSYLNAVSITWIFSLLCLLDLFHVFRLLLVVSTDILSSIIVAVITSIVIISNSWSYVCWLFVDLKGLYSYSVSNPFSIVIWLKSSIKNVSSAFITSSFFVEICLEASLKVFFNWSFIRSYFSSGVVAFISSLWLLDKLADLSKQYANISCDWTVPYDFAFYSLSSNSVKNAQIDILAGLLNNSNASKA